MNDSRPRLSCAGGGDWMVAIVKGGWKPPSSEITTSKGGKPPLAVAVTIWPAVSVPMIGSKLKEDEVEVEVLMDWDGPPFVVPVLLWVLLLDPLYWQYQLETRNWIVELTRTVSLSSSLWNQSSALAWWKFFQRKKRVEGQEREGWRWMLTNYSLGPSKKQWYQRREDGMVRLNETHPKYSRADWPFYGSFRTLWHGLRKSVFIWNCTSNRWDLSRFFSARYGAARSGILTVAELKAILVHFVDEQIIMIGSIYIVLHAETHVPLCPSRYHNRGHSTHLTPVFELHSFYTALYVYRTVAVPATRPSSLWLNHIPAFERFILSTP